MYYLEEPHEEEISEFIKCKNANCDEVLHIDEYLLEPEYAPDCLFCSMECLNQWYNIEGWEIEEEFMELEND